MRGQGRGVKERAIETVTRGERPRKRDKWKTPGSLAALEPRASGRANSGGVSLGAPRRSRGGHWGGEGSWAGDGFFLTFGDRLEAAHQPGGSVTFFCSAHCRARAHDVDGAQLSKLYFASSDGCM